MKVLMNFSNQDKKPEIITPFINLNNCKATDSELIVPGIVKIDYSNEAIKCFCFGLDVVEKILSSVCAIQIDSDNNNGIISFPKSLSDVMLESKIIDFQKVLDLASNGKVQYVNTEKKSLKALVPLSQWLSADLIVNQEKAYINFKFSDYEISVSDGSAMQFCSRVKSHPLISASSLGNYFDFGTEAKIKPSIEYLCFWKVLKSENGYKKYSTFMNDSKDKITVIYDEGKKYRCEFNGGKVDFYLLGIGDKYPKKVVIQIEQINEISVLESLQKSLNFNTIELIAKIVNLKLTTAKLINELKFYKDDDFFIFTNVRDNFKAQYDIGSGTLTIKQEFRISDNINKEYLEDSLEKATEWVDYILKNAE